MRITIRAIALACVATLAGSVAAQEAPKGKPDYQSLAALPDWNGVWSPDWSQLYGGPPTPPKLTAAGQKQVDDYKAGQARGENLQTEAANCTPPGMPGIMRQPYPIEFIFSPGRVTIAHETYSQVRRVYTDGRKLPDDPDPAFNGWSIGHWEGDTLVVDTIGVNVRNSIQAGLHPSEQMRIRERFRMEKPDLMIVETTITDPTILTQPYVSRQAFVRKADWEIREYVCQENNRDGADEFGRPSMDIR
jgi:hypothetical protein